MVDGHLAGGGLNPRHPNTHPPLANTLKCAQLISKDALWVIVARLGEVVVFDPCRQLNPHLL